MANNERNVLFHDVIMRHENTTESHYNVYNMILHTAQLSQMMSINAELTGDSVDAFWAIGKIPFIKVIRLWDWINFSIQNRNIFIARITTAIVIRQRQSGGIHSSKINWLTLFKTNTTTDSCFFQGNVRQRRVTIDMMKARQFKLSRRTKQKGKLIHLVMNIPFHTKNIQAESP